MPDNQVDQDNMHHELSEAHHDPLIRNLHKDPMQRQLDPDAKSYWVERDQTTDPARYFRQF